jgi:NADH-quinone oxidoreductase subunit L
VLGGHHALEHFLAPIFAASEKLKATHQSDPGTEWMLMGVSVALAVITVIIAWNKFSKKPDLEESKGLGKVLENKWYVDELYDTIIVKPLNWLGRFFNRIIERSVIDGFVNGIGRGIQYGSRQLRLLQSGQVGSYILLMVLSIVVFFAIIFFKKL